MRFVSPRAAIAAEPAGSPSASQSRVSPSIWATVGTTSMVMRFESSTMPAVCPGALMKSGEYASSVDRVSS